MKKRTEIPLILHKRSIIGFLALRAQLVQLPAVTWPLEVAFEILHNEAPRSGQISRLLGDLPAVQSAPDVRVPGVTALVSRLTVEGHLRPQGTGWNAALSVESTWVESHQRLFELLSPQDQRVIDDASQRLVAMTTILSKKEAA